MPMGAQMRFSIIFEPLPRGVRVTVRYDRPRAGNALVQTLIRLLAKSQTKAARQGWVVALNYLESLIAEDIADGTISPELAAEVTDEQMQGNIREAIGKAVD
ncbi:MAG: hypothetical protein OSB82_18825 [Alphaproteobacteria bacterium]|nr:hypothetical protein [Alphaproteobacteria bacterium]